MHSTPTPSRALRRAQPHTGQAGATLIEAIIAIVLAGMVVLSLAAAMLTIVRTNASTADRQQVDAGMGSFSESLRAAKYLPCDDPALPGDHLNYQEEYDNWDERWNPAPLTATVVDVEYWNGSDYVEGCAADSGAQQLTLRVTLRDQGIGEPDADPGRVRAERHAQIVKRQR